MSKDEGGGNEHEEPLMGGRRKGEEERNEDVEFERFAVDDEDEVHDNDLDDLEERDGVRVRREE